MSNIDFIANTNCQLGECPRWNKNDQMVYWTDIDGHKLWRVALDGSKLASVDVQAKVGCFAFRPDGSMVLAMEYSIYSADPFNDDDSYKKICETMDPDNAILGVRFNDGCCDEKGRFYVGTYDPTKSARSALYVLEPKARKLRKLHDGLTTFNGLSFHPNGKEVWYADTPLREIYSCSYDAKTGDIGEKKVVYAFPIEQQARPDGGCFDNDGNYWCAMYAGGRVHKITYAGELVETHQVPSTYTTMCAFVGEKLDQMVVTAAFNKNDKQDKIDHPAAGGLFKVDIKNATGIELPLFQG